MDFQFGTMSIIELGQTISSRLKEDGVTQKSELCIYLNDEEFKKVDEDLFFRNRKSIDEEFVPSEGEIDINFELVRVLIKVKKSEE